MRAYNVCYVCVDMLCMLCLACYIMQQRSNQWHPRGAGHLQPVPSESTVDLIYCVLDIGSHRTLIPVVYIPVTMNTWRPAVGCQVQLDCFLTP
jgi:hypothetical protein